MGFAGDPNWARARAIHYKDTYKGAVKFPSFTMPITPSIIAAAKGRILPSVALPTRKSLVVKKIMSRKVLRFKRI